MKLNIQSNYPLKALNTFGVRAKADYYIAIESPTCLEMLYQEQVFDHNFLILGGGSNILFTQDYKGYIIHNTLKGIGYELQGDSVYVRAAGGEIWNDLVWYCIAHGFAGLENMVLIPGTVGASPVQNIGAYGTELMDVFDSCIAFDTHTGTFRNFAKEDCHFSYRDSIFKGLYKNRFIISEVTYKLSLNARINTAYGAIQQELQKRAIQQPSIRDIAEVVAHIRVEKLPDPSTIGNAGSFFKNPIITADKFISISKEFPAIIHYPMHDGRQKIAAGWLIEQCGWKGKQLGNVAVWPQQALVLVNLGQATGEELYALSSKIVNDVSLKFDIQLEREVNIL